MGVKTSNGVRYSPRTVYERVSRVRPDAVHVRPATGASRCSRPPCASSRDAASSGDAASAQSRSPGRRRPRRHGCRTRRPGVTSSRARCAWWGRRIATAGPTRAASIAAASFDSCTAAAVSPCRGRLPVLEGRRASRHRGGAGERTCCSSRLRAPGPRTWRLRSATGGSCTPQRPRRGARRGIVRELLAAEVRRRPPCGRDAIGAAPRRPRDCATSAASSGPARGEHPLDQVRLGERRRLCRSPSGTTGTPGSWRQDTGWSASAS